MKDKNKTKEQLINELEIMRQQIAELGAFATKCKLAEEDLKETRDHLNNLIDSSLDCIIVTDRKGYVIKVNQYFLKLFGYREEEVVGKHIMEWTPMTQEGTYESTTGELLQIGKEFANNASIKMSKLVAVGKITHWESYYFRKDKKVIPVEQNIVFLYNKDNERIGAVAIIRDMTERKRAEEALKNSNALFKAVIEQSPFGIQVCEGNADQWELTIINKEAQRITGATEDEQKRLGISEVETPYPKSYAWKMFYSNGSPLNMHEAPLAIAMSEGKSTKNQEMIVRKSDGVESAVVCNAAPVYNDNGELIAGVMTFSDITATKWAESERIKLSAAVEQAAEIVVIMGLDGIIEYVNPALGTVMGYTPKEVIGKRLFFSKKSLYDSIYDKKFLQRICDTISQGNVWRGNITHKKKDGTLLEAEQTISPIRDKSGRIINYVSIARDVTSELMLEKQLRQAQKMEAIGTLAGGIAHDFNNILAALMGYTEMSLEDIPEESPAKHNLEQILKSTIRAKDLVKQILAFSRKGEQERRPVQIKLVVKEAVKLLRASIPTTVDIIYDINTQSGMVMADPTQIHQVLMNLCTNAADAMQGKGGLLEINLSPFVLKLEDAMVYPHLKPGPHVKLSIRDTGSGIGPEVINRIFDPFFTTKEVGRGTGMGLAVVHGIVKGHGGTITVQSDQNQGTTFNILLPAVEEEPKEEIKASQSLMAGSECILVIDDEEILLDVGERMLKSLGYEVIAKNSSLEALGAFKQEPEKYDLVITDQTMPHMTGYNLAKQLINLRPDIPIILCTGYSETVSSEKAKEAGIQEFIMKPIKRKEMAETIRKVLDKKQKG